jgi:hypothetical protein
VAEAIGKLVLVAGEVAVDAMTERRQAVQQIHGNPWYAAGVSGRTADPRYVKRFVRHRRDRIMQECSRVDETASAEERR